MTELYASTAGQKTCWVGPPFIVILSPQAKNFVRLIELVT